MIQLSVCLPVMLCIVGKGYILQEKYWAFSVAGPTV